MNSGVFENGVLIDWILLVSALAVTLGPIAHRLFWPIPETDLSAVKAYLADHAEELVRLEPKVFGGPWHRNFGGLPFQGGRPYRAVVREPDGRQNVHVVAVDGLRRGGEPRVKELIDGVWVRS